MSITHPLAVVHVGDDWDFSGPLNDPNGNPLPLTGASIIWDLWTIDFTEKVMSLSLGSGISVSSNATATIAYGPTGEQTSSIPPGTYYDTVKVTLSVGNGGMTYTVIEGLINAASAS